MAITDNFDRPSLGSSWETVLGTAWVTTGSVTANPVSQYANTACRRTETGIPDDHYSTVETEKKTGAGDGSSYNCPAVRMDGSGNCYFFDIDTFGDVSLYKRAGGTNTSIGSNSSGQTYSANTMVARTMSATGTTIKCFLAGVEVISVTDASLATGRPGMFCLTGETSLIPRFDNFECTAEAAAGQPAGKRMARIAFAGYQPGRGIMGI